MTLSASIGGGAVRTRRYLSVPSGKYPAAVGPLSEPAPLGLSGTTPLMVSSTPPQAARESLPLTAAPPAPPPASSEASWDQDLIRDEFAVQIEEAMEREVLSPPIPAPLPREEKQGRWGGVGLGLLAGGSLGLLASFLLVRLIQPDLVERPLQSLSALSSSEMVSAGLIFLAFLFLGAGAGSRWRSRRSPRD